MRILIADDHKLILEGLKVLLQRLEPETSVVACGDFENALAAAAEGERFDLVILNLHMPGMNGVLGVKTFRSHFPDLPLVVISGRYRHVEIRKVLYSGAAGFLPKSLAEEAMVNALRLVLAGERFIPAELFDAKFSAGGGRGASNGNGAGASFNLLTARQSDVLEQLLNGLSNTEIGRVLDICEVTVKLHLRNIYPKLGAKNRIQAVMIATDAQWQR